MIAERRTQAFLVRAIAVVSAALWAPTAEASPVTIGDVTQAPGGPDGGCGSVGRGESTIVEALTVPIDGTIIEWSFRTGWASPSTTAKLKVLDPVATTTWTVVGEEDFPAFEPER